MWVQTCRDRCNPARPRFVFSSRRRHTRFDCDWSSDVCSSDLMPDGAADRDADEAAGLLAAALAGQPAAPGAADRGERERAVADHRPVGQRIAAVRQRSEEHTSELQSQSNLVCRLLLEKKKLFLSIQLFVDIIRTTASSTSIRRYPGMPPPSAFTYQEEHVFTVYAYIDKDAMTLLALAD